MVLLLYIPQMGFNVANETQCFDGLFVIYPLSNGKISTILLLTSNCTSRGIAETECDAG
jgi:hypothetical protein